MLFRSVGEIPGLPAADVIEVGYCNLPARIEDIAVRIAPWTEDDFAAADEAARGVVRAVRSGIFWPLVPDAPGFQEYDAICQSNVIRDEGDEG